MAGLSTWLVITESMAEENATGKIVYAMSAHTEKQQSKVKPA